MLLRPGLPSAYARWNRRWGAPFGRRIRNRIPTPLWTWPGIARVVGPFAFQSNNSTREYEFPWAFFALDLQPGMRVLELGGSNAGLQFAMARSGCKVVNVDPGERARGRGWPVGPEFHALLNRRFATDVQLCSSFIEEANLPSDSFDRAVCVSTLEHIPEPEIPRIARELSRLLKPGGLLVLTVDLFLGLVPFTAQLRNEWGTNVSLSSLIDDSGLRLVHGRRQELCGLPEFDPAAVLSLAKRGELLLGTDESAVQALVLRKPDAGGDSIR
jgi:SAM-dependent methyltransferase